MPDSYLQISISIVGFVSDVFIQLFSFRFIKSLSLLKSEFLGFAFGFLCIFLIELYFFYTKIVAPYDFLPFLVANLIIYSALGHCYFTFINLGETARRIRILRELYDSGQGLSLDEILERYDAKEIIERRIARLLNNGQILFKDGKYYIGNPLMLFIAKVIVVLKLLLLGKRSEFN